MKKSAAIIFAFFCLSIDIHSQNNADKFWSPVNEAKIAQSGKRQIVPQKYTTFKLNGAGLKNKLFSAPHERTTRINQSGCIISLPLPDGSIQQFRIVESPIMEPALAAQFPDMKTFSVKGIDDVYANGKLDWNEFGFHGMILTTAGDFFIDPYCLANTTDYISYYTEDFEKPLSQRIAEAGLIISAEDAEKKSAPKSTGGINTANRTAAIECIGTQLRTYRLAVACTGEYAIAATGTGAPTLAQTLAKIQTSINRVDGVYEKELDVRLVLVATETLVVFTDPSTDPFSGNNSTNTLIGESQSVITGAIGTANFDIGHTFSTGGGGLANYGCVCRPSDKARGITGSDSPVGDPYDIDYVAHEMGHQFGGSHTFNAITVSCMGNRNAPTAVEPGSGITIMAYAGICGGGDNIAAHSIPYFHATSFEEIRDYITSGSGNNCPTFSNTGNQPPVVTTNGDYIIPVSTPFSLTGSATDPDGDALTYSWEETDAGTTGGTWNTGNRPYFRSYAPVATGTRFFPTTAVVSSGNFTSTRGEYLPTTAQVLSFRLTARDNKMGGGGVCSAVSTVTVDNSSGSPFAVVYPSALGIVWGSGSQKVVTWDVSGTDQSPILCDFVTISISLDNGNTYTTLISGTANDGSEMITVPTLTAINTTCRIKVAADGNIFYDTSNNRFTITTETEVGISEISQNNAVGLSVWPNPAGNQVNFSVNNLDAGNVTKLTVTDILGKPVMQSSYYAKTELKETIDLSNISTGVYFIKVTNNNKQSVYRIVKN